MRFVLAFGLCGIALAVLAVRLAREATGAWWVLAAVEASFGVCFVSVAAAYGLRGAGVSVEAYLAFSRWSPVYRLVLLPYLALAALALYVCRWFSRECPFNEVTPGLSIGRLPFPSERGRLKEAGVRAVLNLCWELPRLSGVDREPGIATAHVPILDGAPPTPRQFTEAVDRVARWRAEGRPVLVHCAQGHGRSATILAASLVRLGLASDVGHALSMVRAARPLARPSCAQRAALERYAAEGWSEAAPGGGSDEV